MGALVECEPLPPIGATVVISRGKLAIAGEVIRSKNSFFGVRFSEKIELHAWLTDAAKPNLPSRQTEEDMPPQAQFKPENDDGLFSHQTLDQRISEEIQYVSRIVGVIGEVLVNDPVLRVRHASSLQQLDMGKQMLAEIAEIVAAKNKLDRISSAVTGPMRARMLRENYF
jgi:hypothetical protein